MSNYLGIGAQNLGVTTVQLQRVITTDDPNVFRRDWTLSFLPGMDKWVSFHSHSPLLLANSRTRLVGSYNHRVWDYGSGAPGNFFDTIFPLSVNVIFAPQTGKTYLLQSVSWVSRVTTGNQEIKNLTFTKATVFDSYQLSDTVALVPLTTIRLSEGEWRFNSFRDLAKTGFSLLTEGLPNPLAVDQLRDWTQQKRLVDKWFGLRLEVDNLSGNMLYLLSADALYRESIR